MFQVRNGDQEFGWGVVVNFQKKAPKVNQPLDVSLEPEFIVDVLLNCSKDSLRSNFSRPRPATDDDRNNEMSVIPVLMKLITSISSVRLFLPNDLRSYDNKQSILRSLEVRYANLSAISCLCQS